MLQYKQWKMIVLKDPTEPVLEASQGDNYTVHSQLWAGDCFYLQSSWLVDREIEIQAMKSTQFKGSFVGISEIRERLQNISK